MLYDGWSRLLMDSVYSNDLNCITETLKLLAKFSNSGERVEEMIIIHKKG
jgi:hypothetical protein